MSERFCESCIETKPIEEFKKYGHECRSCKQNEEKNHQRSTIKKDLNVFVDHIFQKLTQKKNMK